MKMGMRKVCLLLPVLVCLLSLPSLRCARADQPKPAGKDAKIGSVGKEYFVLPKSYVVKCGGMAVGFGGLSLSLVLFPGC